MIKILGSACMATGFAVCAGVCAAETVVRDQSVENAPWKLSGETAYVFAKSELKGETDLRVIVRPVNCWGVVSCKKTAVCRL